MEETGKKPVESEAKKVKRGYIMKVITPASVEEEGKKKDAK